MLRKSRRNIIKVSRKIKKLLQLDRREISEIDHLLHIIEKLISFVLSEQAGNADYGLKQKLGNLITQCTVFLERILGEHRREIELIESSEKLIDDILKDTVRSYGNNIFEQIRSNPQKEEKRPFLQLLFKYIEKNKREIQDPKQFIEILEGFSHQLAVIDHHAAQFRQILKVHKLFMNLNSSSLDQKFQESLVSAKQMLEDYKKQEMSQAQETEQFSKELRSLLQGKFLLLGFNPETVQ